MPSRAAGCFLAVVLAAAALAPAASGQTAAADLRLGLKQSAESVRVGDQITFTVTLFNHGPATATGVTVVNRLPPPELAEFVSGPDFCQPPSASQSGRDVVCTPPNLGPGAGGDGPIVLHAVGEGALTYDAAAAANEPDPNEADNGASITATATPAADPPPPVCAPRRAALDRGLPIAPAFGVLGCDGGLPAPAAGVTVNVRPAGGTVLFRPPDAPAAGFFTLAAGQQIPVGSTVDVSKGTVRLTAAAERNGTGIAKGEFSGGVFTLLQTGGREPITELRMTAGDFAVCASPVNAKRRVRRLFGDGRGRFRTRGRHSAATVRGTKWTMTDRCDGTLTTVRQGVVVVRDLAKHRNITLRTGGRYLARP
jgi:uncharacterized repeat protein (TIGR01451 family)